MKYLQRIRMNRALKILDVIESLEKANLEDRAIAGYGLSMIAVPSIPLDPPEGLSGRLLYTCSRCLCWYWWEERTLVDFGPIFICKECQGGSNTSE